MAPAPQKVALVTGAARGIGLAVAKRFLADGWRVALLDIEGATAAWRGRRRWPTPMRRWRCIATSPTPPRWRMRSPTVETRFGRLDALVNNAGIAVFAPLLETSDADWRRVLAVNLTGPFLCTKAAAPLMREHGGGAIVNITSISAVRASTLRSAYGTSKAGLAHLTKQLAVELASLGIRVNGVAPGPVETAMAKQVHTPEIRADYHDAIPLNRYGLEEELAEAVFFLCSDRASYITGQILAVDGGFDAAGIGLPTLRGERSNGYRSAPVDGKRNDRGPRAVRRTPGGTLSGGLRLINLLSSFLREQRFMMRTAVMKTMLLAALLCGMLCRRPTPKSASSPVRAARSHRSSNCSSACALPANAS